MVRIEEERTGIREVVRGGVEMFWIRKWGEVEVEVEVGVRWR